MSSKSHSSERGFALVAALLILAILFVLGLGLLFQTQTEHLVVANEYDHLAAMGHAEAGMTWAESRFWASTSASKLLRGPDGTASTADDNLLGLRDLSLTATSQFDSSNESTASAIVSRDFDGQGARSWEVVRVEGTDGTHALVHVRVDDNYDDDPDDPTNNDPLRDKDRQLRLSVVAEYPVFVDASGVEQAVAVDRGRAQRILVATVDHGAGLPAISTNDDLDLNGNIELCGDCGSAHSNGDVTMVSTPSVCQDVTAAGSYTGSTSGIGGDAGGGYAPLPLPVVNPYDDLYVPSIEIFDTSTDASLPEGLRCPLATTTDPGASKYFALVSGAGKDGEVWKAYWDFTNNRWTWRMIDDLGDATDTILDDCGRVQGDPQFGAGKADPVTDADAKTFFGLAGAKQSWQFCPTCGSSGSDLSLCGLTDNDFNTTGYYPAGGGSVVAWPPLPGNFTPDGNADFNAETRTKAEWGYSDDRVYSPLYGAVIWIFGELKLNGNAGAGSPADFVCSATAGCTPTALPRGSWSMSVVALGTISLSGSANISPANPKAGYHYLLVAGRDVSISGNAQVDTDSCGGGCPTTGPADLEWIAGIYAAHEQLGILGGTNLFGFVVAEEAVSCASAVTPTSKIVGNPEIYYDCDHPPNPWAMAKQRIFWQEVR